MRFISDGIIFKAESNMCHLVRKYQIEFRIEVHLKQVFRHFPGGVLKDQESPDSSWSRFQPIIILGMY